MKKILVIIISIFLYSNAISQETEKPNTIILLKELAENGCKCIDSIQVYNKSKIQVSKEINKCIDEQTVAYQLGSKLIKINDLNASEEMKDGKKQINISINTNEKSAEYKAYYYEMERYLMENCISLNEKIKNNEEQSKKSVSKNQKAIDLYSNGNDELKKENFKKAIEYFEKALKIDPEFTFAWDNLGVSYRKLDNYDKAIESYEKSLEINPKGITPLQNIAVVYQYKEEYQKAIESYQKLAEIDSNNPEIYYGMGQVYAINLNDYEKGLDNMCKAYNMYIKQKSPYRTDAEKVINLIYAEMKKQGKEDNFNKILKSNNISQN